MPWEVDYAYTTFSKFKASSYYLSDDVKISIDTALNLSNYIINWKESTINKGFFIEKYNQASDLLSGWSTHKKIIYDGDSLYGHLDLQRSTIQTDVDGYISLCPDMYFHEHLLHYLIESSRTVTNKYFVITPQIYKMWDSTWDFITYKDYLNIPYTDWDKGDVYDIKHKMDNMEDPPELQKLNQFKWAGWFDFYSKGYFEELVPIWNDWNGYGPYDFFGMIVSQIAINNKLDFSQYLLKNQIIFEYTTGIQKTNNSSALYKKYLKLNEIPNQRKIFESNFNFYINRWYNYIKDKKLIT